MNKSINFLAVLVFLTASLIAQDIKAEPQKESQKIQGFYLGAGGGLSSSYAYLSQGYYQDNTSVYLADTLSDTDNGYLIYAGYQFNKIVAIEIAHADYGSFSDSALDELGATTTFTSAPIAHSIYANLGYNFENGLRPFAQLGLAYVSTNASTATQNINIDDGFAMHFGLGLEYTPLNLYGLGLRVAYAQDTIVDMSHDVHYNNVDSSSFFMNLNTMLYLGAQYKF